MDGDMAEGKQTLNSGGLLSPCALLLPPHPSQILEFGNRGKQSIYRFLKGLERLGGPTSPQPQSDSRVAEREELMLSRDYTCVENSN